MKLFKHQWLLFIGLILSTHTFAQISVAGTPYELNNDIINQDVPIVVMPALDFDQIKEEDIQDAAIGLPPRFGKKIEVDINLEDDGIWQTLANGDRLWRVSIQSKSALSINLLYNSFYLPEGALLYIYNQDFSHIIGGFTARNNKSDGQFATGLVYGEIITISYYEPAEVQGQGQIDISDVIHGYRYIPSPDKAFGDSGNCNIDTACPDGNDWRDEIKSVALMLLNGTRWCSGALTANTTGDCRPLFVTANHCLGSFDAVNNPNANTLSFYWRYESPTCGGADGPTNLSTVGATILANSGNPGAVFVSDFAILDLTEDPVEEGYDVYFSGWDAGSAIPQGVVGIHHPAGDVKKICFDTDPLTATAYLNDNGGTPTHWRVAAWNDGTTEGGSSGSPIFDLVSRRSIGHLSGGFAACSGNIDNDEPDWYGQTFYSWLNNGATDARRRMKDWLDPNNTGLTGLDGYSPDVCALPDYRLSASPTTATNCGNNTLTYTIEVQSINGYVDAVTLSTNGLPGAATASFASNPVVPGNNTVLTINGLNNVSDGTYTFDVIGNSTTGSKTLMLELVVADQLAATLVSPANGTIDVSTAPSLTWNAASGASSYDVQVATDAAFSNVVTSSNVTTTNWTVSLTLNVLTLYYWRVRHVRTCGNDPWSAPFSFTTADANSGTCDRPIQLVCGDIYNGNNADGEDNFQQHDPNGGSLWTGPELVFEFQAAAGDVEAEITGLTADLDLYLFTDCGDPVNSELDESESVTGVETVSANVSGGTYYLMVDGYQGATSTFELTLTCTSPPAVNCPTTLAVNDNPIAASTYSAANTLTSAGTISSGSTVILEAGQSVTLQAGFLAAAGSDFTARIQSCVTTADRLEERSEKIALDNVRIFPNPFSQQSAIDIQLTEVNDVQIELFSLTGQRIRTIANERDAQSGTHRYQLDARGLTTGMYVLVIRVGDRIGTRKLSLVK
ncbi:MAG: 3-coathanger stack domain-containing protein [Bacteroidota bacterium]